MQDVRILVVEDERKLAQVLQSALTAEHNGQITLHERPRGGSEFRIRLPLAPSVETTPDRRTTPVPVGG